MFNKNKLLAKLSKIFKNVLLYFAIIDFIKRNIERMVVTNEFQSVFMYDMLKIIFLSLLTTHN